MSLQSRPFDGGDTEWNRLVAGFATGHILQTAQWATFKGSYSWSPERLVVANGSQIRGAALAMTRQLPLPGRTICYVPKGPCADPGEAEAWAALAQGLRAFGEQRRALFVRVDPDLTAGNTAAVAALAAEGFRPSPEQVQFRNTYRICVARSDAELRAAMGRKGREHLNRAARAGVVVRPGRRDELDRFYEMYRETAQRQQFLIRPRDYYLLDWQLFIDAGMAALFMAEVHGTPVSGAVVYWLGDRAWYLYGASTNRHREARPNEALQWTIMRWLRDRGIRTYDLWGAPDDDAPDDRMAGVAQFKRSLGGVHHAWIGAWDLVLDPALYRLWTAWMPRLLSLGRRLIGSGPPRSAV